MQLIGYVLIVAVLIVWAAIGNFCFDLMTAPSDAKLYTGAGLLLFSIPAMVRLIKSIYKLTKLKENSVDQSHHS